MKIRQALCGLVASTALWSMMAPAPALAAGNIWMDEHAEVQAKDFKRIILFPIRYGEEPEGRVDVLQADNDMLAKRVQKRIKKTTFLRVEDPGDAKKADKSQEKRQIMRDNPAYENLLQHYATEQDRARAVYDATGAEGYLLPHIRKAEVRIDHSPATPVRVRMETYYDEIDGPRGARHRVGYHSWWQNHVIPAHDRALQMLDMDFTLYDAYTGKKAMTLVDYYRCYGVTHEHAFDQVAKNFTGDWNRLKDDRSQKVAEYAPTLGFGSLTLPDDTAQDEFSLRTIYYVYKDEAGDTLRNVRVVDEPGTQARYYVRGIVTDYARGETWIPPSVETSLEQYRTTHFTWRDDKGQEHEGKRVFYRTSIADSFGYYRFWYRVRANLQLVDGMTGAVLLEKSYDEMDADRYANALRSMFNDFYRRVDRTVDVRGVEA